jgi:hypothetical protein
MARQNVHPIADSHDAKRACRGHEKKRPNSKNEPPEKIEISEAPGTIKLLSENSLIPATTLLEFPATQA